MGLGRAYGGVRGSRASNATRVSRAASIWFLLRKLERTLLLLGLMFGIENVRPEHGVARQKKQSGQRGPEVTLKVQ